MRVSVVLPYYENARTLVACLTSLVQQTLRPDEIVVVDDGSKAAARPIIEAQSWPVPVHLHETNHCGQSGATNVGILAAKGSLVILTCADIIPDKRLVEEHCKAHREAPDDIAVLGPLPYAPTVKMTPFMRYLDSSDVQFAFDRIADPENVSPYYLYAPNFSTSRARLLQVGMFDEKFVYGYQDTDLGVRLADAGVRFVYRSQAVGHHDHPNNVRAFVRRQISVGESTLHWLEKYDRPDEMRKMRLLLATYYTRIGSLDTYVDDAERLEKCISARPTIFTAVKRELFNRYTVISGTAVTKGMSRSPARLHAIFNAPDAPIVPASMAPL